MLTINVGADCAGIIYVRFLSYFWSSYIVCIILVFPSLSSSLYCYMFLILILYIYIYIYNVPRGSGGVVLLQRVFCRAISLLPFFLLCSEAHSFIHLSHSHLFRSYYTVALYKRPDCTSRYHWKVHSSWPNAHIRAFGHLNTASWSARTVINNYF
jgi:hypothetical protein